MTVTSLDYETATSHEVLIRVEDQGSPPLGTDVTVYVTVSDVNEAAPVFAG